jgi:hypothetical protein
LPAIAVVSPPQTLAAPSQSVLSDASNVETFIPFVPASRQVSLAPQIQSSGQTTAHLELEFCDSGYRITDWGQVRRQGDAFVVDTSIERWTGGACMVITQKSHDYDLGSLPPGQYTFTFMASGQVIKSQSFTVQTEETFVPVVPASWQVEIDTTTRPSGETTQHVELTFPTPGYRVTDWGQVQRQGNAFVVDTSMERSTGIALLVITQKSRDYDLGVLSPGQYTFTFMASGQVIKSQAFSLQPGATWSGWGGLLYTETKPKDRYFRLLGTDPVNRLTSMIADDSGPSRKRIPITAACSPAPEQNLFGSTAHPLFLS